MRVLSITVFAGLVFAFLLAWYCPAEARVFSNRYDRDIKSAVSMYWPGVDWRWWKAQLYQESKLDPNAQSPAGAKGLAQFMGPTWADMLKQLKMGFVSPFSARHAIAAGAFYMAKQKLIWNKRAGRPERDKWQLAQASYNAGAKNLIDAQAWMGGPLLFKDIIKGLVHITGKRNSHETITYVERIEQWYKEMVLTSEF